MPLKSDRNSLDALFSLIYEELRRLARGVLRREGASAGISPTTLVNEAWLKLAGSPQAANTSPLHFRHIAARAMRQVLVDAARRRNAVSNGGGLKQITFDPAIEYCAPFPDHQIVALDEALDVLQRRSPRQAHLVEAHFFGGLTYQECAEIFSISEATAMRDWRAARAWLAREIRESNTEPLVTSNEREHD